jgi:CspA family cold shock protein
MWMIRGRQQERAMAVGKVKWFSAQKGCGYIQPETGGKDVLVHNSAVQEAGLEMLGEGQKVFYDIVGDREHLHAANLQLAE